MGEALVILAPATILCGQCWLSGILSVSCIDTNLSSSRRGTPCVLEESENAGDNRGIGGTVGGDAAHEILASQLLRAGGGIVADSHNVQPSVAAGRLRTRTRSAGEAAILLFVVCCFFVEYSPNRSIITEHAPPTPAGTGNKQSPGGGPQGRAPTRDREVLPDHNPHMEFVFNRADIDHSSIVWARDMGDAKNRELIDYYPDRQVWLLEPDSPSLTVTPYSGKDPTH